VVTLTEHNLDDLQKDGPPLEAWYAAHAPAIFSFLARRVGRHQAEDLTAQVFVEALEAHTRFDPERGTVRAWLFGIAQNLMRNQVRKEQRAFEVFARSGFDPIDDDPMGAAESRLVATDEWPGVAAALADLAPLDRDVLFLYCFGELDYAEIGEALGLPVGTVSSKMHRIRKKLRRRLPAPGTGGGR
jgi:RNA polymerase sigma-70 factor (ECF subfamily)